MDLNSGKLNYAAHVGLLRKLYPQGRVISMYPDLIWQCEIKPTPLSKSYTIRLEYNLNFQPKIFVVKTKLKRGEFNKLPHVYSRDRQHLCLHYPQEKKWTHSDNLADTIIPWASEWLFHYELWEISGNWNGGGTVH